MGLEEFELIINGPGIFEQSSLKFAAIFHSVQKYHARTQIGNMNNFFIKKNFFFSSTSLFDIFIRVFCDMLKNKELVSEVTHL